MSKNTVTARGPVGRKLIQMLRRERGKKVVDFVALAEGSRRAEELQQDAGSRGDLADYDPSHGWYVLAQRQFSILIEQTGALRETRCFTDPINGAEDESMPIGPPRSPLTGSYFFYWSVRDSPNDLEARLTTATDLHGQFAAAAVHHPDA